MLLQCKVVLQSAVHALRAPRRFDTVFLGDQLRIAKDSRGDTLVVERDGPPRTF